MLYLSAVSSPGSTSCITSWLAVSAGKSTNTATCTYLVFVTCFAIFITENEESGKDVSKVFFLSQQYTERLSPTKKIVLCLVTTTQHWLNTASLHLVSDIIVILLLSSLWFIWNNCICQIPSSNTSMASNIRNCPIIPPILYLKLSTIVWPARPSSRLETICPASCPLSRRPHARHPRLGSGPRSEDPTTSGHNPQPSASQAPISPSSQQSSPPDQDKVRCLEAVLIILIDGMQMRKNYAAILQLVLFYSSFYYCRPFKARFQ